MSDHRAVEPLGPGINCQSACDIVTKESIGLQLFEVLLDKTQHVYYTGQIVSGKVKLQLDSPISGMVVKLECRGEGQVYFTNRSTGFRRKVSAQETYLHDVIYLTRSDSSDAEIRSDGFSFSFNLPEKLPCSFEGRYGRVRYSIKSTLEFTRNSGISSEPLAFTIAPVLDLNQHSLAPLPLSESNTKTFTGHLKPLSMSVFIPVRGFVPGQTIPLKINLKNESNVDVKKLRILFKKVVVYRSADNIRKHKEIVVEIHQPVQRNCEVYDCEFDVPAIPPSGRVCDLIDVCYTLKVEACVDINEWYYRMFHKNLKIRMAIVVGTCPLRNYEDPIDSSDDPQSISKKDKSVQWAETVSKDNESKGCKYQSSRIYRSSKPERDDPVGENGDDAHVEAYAPMYRVYKFDGGIRG
ncbi:arrestin domain-containing protein 2-like [Fopius arisanus]|uniref:Arrestin domain-containing protein 2-like n=1 Tax=Fopius arisanus TaxID=64838 RepID=A0A9R1T1A0_9HYME|nr:PREDICTED: arrestin domain-containing protein 2-like [Fopius arisanus]